MKRTPLLKPVAETLVFKRNKYNPDLYECITGAKCIASIERFPQGYSQSWNLYTCMPDVIFEGSFETYERAQSRAQWRANLQWSILS